MQAGETERQQADQHLRKVNSRSHANPEDHQVHHEFGRKVHIDP